MSFSSLWFICIAPFIIEIVPRCFSDKKRERKRETERQSERERDATVLYYTFASILIRNLRYNQQMITKITGFAKNGKKQNNLPVITGFPAYQVTLGRRQLSCELYPPLPGKSTDLVFVGVMSDFTGWFVRFHSDNTVCPQLDQRQRRISSACRFDQKANLISCGSLDSSEQSDGPNPSRLQMSLSCKTTGNHC